MVPPTVLALLQPTPSVGDGVTVVVSVTVIVMNNSEVGKGSHEIVGLAEDSWRTTGASPKSEVSKAILVRDQNRGTDEH